MAEFVTRTSKIRPTHTFLRERLLTKEGEVMGRVGQEVLATQTVSRMRQTAGFRILYASQQLKVSHDELKELINLERGTPVSQGTVLAEKKGLIGTNRVESPISGFFYGVHQGRILLRQSPEWVEVRALVPGHITDVIAKRGVVLEVTGSVIEGVWSSPHEANGRLQLTIRSPQAPLYPEQITEESRGSIVVSGFLEDPNVLHRAKEHEVAGIIAGSITADIVALAPDMPFPILVTDGIGQQDMSPVVYDLLQQGDGQEVAIFGKLSRKHPRPELVIPAEETSFATSESDQNNLALHLGQTVRILRAPYNGQLGEVVKLYNRAKTTGIQTRAHGADIRLPDGTSVFIPYANLDSII